MQQVMPLKIPAVITRAMVVKAPMDISLTLRPESPIPVAAISATFSSYCKAPTTESLSQDKGTPRLPLRAITPRRILTPGRTEKVALDIMARLITFLSIPMAIPAR